MVVIYLQQHLLKVLFILAIALLLSQSPPASQRCCLLDAKPTFPGSKRRVKFFFHFLMKYFVPVAVWNFFSGHLLLQHPAESAALMA